MQFDNFALGERYRQRGDTARGTAVPGGGGSD